MEKSNRLDEYPQKYEWDNTNTCGSIDNTCWVCEWEKIELYAWVIILKKSVETSVSSKVNANIIMTIMFYNFVKKMQ